MSKKFIFIVFSVLFFIITNLPAQNIKITEIMFNPAGPEQSDEYVEIFNLSTKIIDLNQWTISDSTGFSLICDAGYGTILKPESFCVIVDPDALSNNSLFLQKIPSDVLIVKIDTQNFGNRGLSNSHGELVSLINPENHYVCSVQYDCSLNEGFSFEKIEFEKGDNTENWEQSRVWGGTPGKINSVSINPSNQCALKIEPNPFSPDNDGFENFAAIAYELNFSYATVNMEIFDIKGRLVKTILNCFSSPPCFSVIWNGRDQNGNRVQSGIYILHFLASDNKTGKTITLQECIVVAGI